MFVPSLEVHIYEVYNAITKEVFRLDTGNQYFI